MARKKKAQSRANRRPALSTQLRELSPSTGPSFSTGRRAGVAPNPRAPWRDIPETWKGTEPEWAIMWAHQALGLREHEHFEYLYVTELTPNGIDFFEYDVQVGIEVFGLYWHYQSGGFKDQSDLERHIRLTAAGFQMVYIDEDHALLDPVYYLREARSLRDHSRFTNGM